MRVAVLCSLLLLAAGSSAVQAWDWDLHFRIAHAGGVSPSAAHGTAFPDMMRRHDKFEFARHYTNEDYYPAGLLLGGLPLTYSTFANAVSAPEKTGFLLYEILHYVAEYRKEATAATAHADFNENLVRLAHYVADLYMPLHLTRNYNGQESGQKGAHERFEDFGDRQITRVVPFPVFAPITSDEDLWRVLQQEAKRNRAVAAELLAIDKHALTCRDYSECFQKARPVFQAQANRAAGLLGAILSYAERSTDTATYGHWAQ